MRLSELLHSDVWDEAGKSYGSVDDVRLVQDGPPLGAFGVAFRVEGLVLGHGALGLRLGFHRGGVRGPWPLKVIFRRLESRASYATWDQVVSYDGTRVVIRGEPGPIPTD